LTLFQIPVRVSKPAARQKFTACLILGLSVLFFKVLTPPGAGTPSVTQAYIVV